MRFHAMSIYFPGFFLDFRSIPPRSTLGACVFEAILLTLSARSTERSEERSVEVLLRSTAPEKSVGHFRTASGSWPAACGTTYRPRDRQEP